MSDDNKVLGSAQGAELVSAATSAEWQPITKPGMVKKGDKLRFRIGDKTYAERAWLILNPGTDKEEVVYDKANNFYFITSMVMGSRSNHKDVEVLAAAATAEQPSLSVPPGTGGEQEHDCGNPGCKGCFDPADVAAELLAAPAGSAWPEKLTPKMADVLEFGRTQPVQNTYLNLRMAALSAPVEPVSEDERDAERYRKVKTMSARQLAVWRGVYGFSDAAVDVLDAPSPTTKESP